MTYIERPEYLEKLINTINTQDIKIITGIRRSGKSYLLEMFIDYLALNSSFDFWIRFQSALQNVG